jgi:hypothetical protein
MAIPQSIQRQGFRKWYERELLAGHSHLVLLLCSGLGILGAMEVFWRQPGAERLLMVASIVVASVIGVWALRRYLFLLMRAEVIANQAVCKGCGAYGRWTVEAHTAEDAPAGEPARMQVCCRKCGGRWQIEW